MLVTLGNEENVTSSAYYKCEGCGENITIKIDWHSGYSWDDARNLVMDFGWVRRIFTKGVDPWFCSKACAHESRRALELEDIWKRRNEN